MVGLEYLTGAGYVEAAAFRGALAGIALIERNDDQFSTDRFGTVREYAADLARRTVCLTLLAGSGSRWVKSVAAAAAAGRADAADAERPRGLYPVRDFLRGRGEIPIAAYALAATEGLGRHLIVVRGWEAEIDAQILAPLGIGPGSRDFFTQEAPYGKPLGHGDAAWQCRSLWRGADYVVANFGGDANSRRTILSSLLALDALRASGVGADMLMPTTFAPSPAYPIELDEGGLPLSFGHAKLRGGAAPAGPGYTNVGVRVYAAAALLDRLEGFRNRYWVEGSGYAIPGNDPEGHELALDNVDAAMAEAGRARILAIARPEELCPAKTVGDIPAFEKAIESVLREDGEA